MEREWGVMNGMLRVPLDNHCAIRNEYAKIKRRHERGLIRRLWLLCELLDTHGLIDLKLCIATVYHHIDERCQMLHRALAHFDNTFTQKEHITFLKQLPVALLVRVLNGDEAVTIYDTAMVVRVQLTDNSWCRPNELVSEWRLTVCEQVYTVPRSIQQSDVYTRTPVPDDATLV